MVRKMTLSVAAALLLVGSISLRASDVKTALVVRLTDGTEVQFITSEVLKVTTDGADVVFKSTNATVAHPRSNVAKLYFKQVIGNSVEQIERNNPAPLFLMQDDYILITSELPLADPAVYTITGMKLTLPMHRTTSNEVQLSIAALPRGIYVVTVNKQSFKFIKK